jgi:3D (Asp-Asp-Asp) domain-containing protein
MISLVRGVISLGLLSMMMVIIIAQTSTEKNLIIANDSQIEEVVNNQQVNSNTVTNNKAVQEEVQDKDKKLVRKTGSSKAAGVSKGKFSATAYCLQGRTAMGHGVRRGIIAADPRVLRLGSQVVVEGGGYTGTYLVSDTGGKIKGNRIDIWMPSCAEARKFGRRTVSVSTLN